MAMMFGRRVHMLTRLPFTAVISAREAVAGFADPNIILMLGDAGPQPILAIRFAITDGKADARWFLRGAMSMR